VLQGKYKDVLDLPKAEKEKDPRYREYLAQRKKLRQNMRDRMPIVAVAPGGAESVVFSHDYAGPVKWRNVVAPIESGMKKRIKQPTDSEPHFRFRTADGKEVMLTRAHWAVDYREMRPGDEVFYPADRGHGPELVTAEEIKKRGLQRVDPKDLLRLDMADIIEHGTRALDTARAAPAPTGIGYARDASGKLVHRRPATAKERKQFARRKATRESITEHNLKRMREESAELPTYKPRAEKLMGKKQVRVPTLWGSPVRFMGIKIPGIKSIAATEFKKQLRP